MTASFRGWHFPLCPKVILWYPVKGFEIGAPTPPPILPSGHSPPISRRPLRKSFLASPALSSRHCGKRATSFRSWFRDQTPSPFSAPVDVFSSPPFYYVTISTFHLRGITGRVESSVSARIPPPCLPNRLPPSPFRQNRKRN